jgi:hypothetical protein
MDTKLCICKANCLQAQPAILPHGRRISYGKDVFSPVPYDPGVLSNFPYTIILNHHWLLVVTQLWGQMGVC